MACNLEILAAAWGTSNVTDKIWRMVTNNDSKLVVEAVDSTFGAQGGSEKYQKWLVVCYRYPGEQPSLAIAKHKSTMTILPKTKPQEDEEVSTILSSNWQDDISNTPSHNPSACSTITIWGAAWGGEDVTTTAQKCVANGEVEVEKLALNEIWGGDSSWYSDKKILVIVYEYSAIPMMSIVKEKREMRFKISPPLCILGATYGCETVTSKVQNYVKNHELCFKPKSDLPPNPALNSKYTYLSFVMVYQFGNEQPRLHISSQSSEVCIRYEPQTTPTKEVVVVNPSQLSILGAAYRLQDITEKIKSILSDDKTRLVTSVNDTTLELADDEWKMYSKTLVVIYRYGTGPPMVSITRQAETATIEKKLLPTFGGLIDSHNIVSNGDTISLIALNNKYVAYDVADSGKLIANSEKSHEFTVVQRNPGSFFLKDKNSQKCCEVDDNGYLIMKSDQEKTPFNLMLSTTGKVKLATNNKFVRLVENQFLKADSAEHIRASTSFQLEVSCCVSTDDFRPSANTKEEQISEQMWLEFVWQATSGFFLALGLEFFLCKSEPSIGLLYFLHENQNFSKALQTLKDEVRSTTNEAEAIRSGIHFIDALWKEGLLWSVFKFLRLNEGTIVYTEIIAQVAQVVLLPETEAPDLLSGLTTWATQLICTSKKLENLPEN